MRKPTIVVILASVAILASVVSFVQPSRSKASSSTQPKIDERDKPPSDETIANMLLPEENEQFHWNVKLLGIQRGIQFASDGTYGPVGTKVYPVRLTYAFTHFEMRRRPGEERYKAEVQEEAKTEVRFWLNEFGEWRAKR